MTLNSPLRVRSYGDVCVFAAFLGLIASMGLLEHYPSADGSPVPDQKFGDSFCVFLSEDPVAPSNRSVQRLSSGDFEPLRGSFSGISLVY